VSTAVSAAKRVVVKVGSSLVTNDGRAASITPPLQGGPATHIAAQKKNALVRKIVLVSSGARSPRVCSASAGVTRPRAVHDLQAAAAVGQMGLVQAYETAFAKYDLHTAQVLLTHEDLADRRRYLNARTTLTTLLALGGHSDHQRKTIPSRPTKIRFGDNDTLAALVTNLIEAQFIGAAHRSGWALHAGIRAKDASATLVRNARAPATRALEAMAGRRRHCDRPWRHVDEGGWRRSARRAPGASTVIACGREIDVVDPARRR